MARDLDLFKSAMADVRPLKGRRRAVMRPAPGKAGQEARTSSSVVQAGPRQKKGSDRPAAFDRGVDRALARGRRSPEATLDLHGMTLPAAERAVARFLEEAAALDLRLVLIVTGKGLRQEGGRVTGGRIREEFPDWLERADNRARVHSLKPAHPRHGGTGAFYVLLRRR